jgi:short-subunit dehydrogenase
MSAYSGKVIWIIGASTGIGRALAVELAGQGANLILSARSTDKLNALNVELGGRHAVIAVDAGDHEGLGRAAETFPKIDSVIFMAAIYAPHSQKTKDISFIHEMLNVNIGGAFNTVNAVLPIFERQGFGQIVLCGSVAGYRGLPFGQPYCATKAAIINYAESLKIELESKNIDVKLISPGFVRTPLTDKNDFPMPMMIEAEDAAKAIVKGLQGRGFEIHFPKKFTWIMKILRALPAPVYFWVARKMKRASAI